MRSQLVLTAILFSVLACAHEVPIDWTSECMPPGGSHADARTAVQYHAQSGEYILQARDKWGQVAYHIVPGPADGSHGLFSVACSDAGVLDFTITDGVMVYARDARKREITPDGTIRVLAMDEARIETGYTQEPGGNGPCIRIGNTLPVEPHMEGVATYPFDVPPGRYRVGVRYMDDRDDSADDAYIRLKIGDRLLGNISLAQDDDQWRDRLFDTEIATGDVLRIEARTDDSAGSGADFCRVSHILIRPLAPEQVEVKHELQAGEVRITRPGIADSGVPPIQARIALQGRSLRCEVEQLGDATPPAGYTALTLLPTRHTPDATAFRMPYLAEQVGWACGALFTTYTSRMESHCTRARSTGSVNEETGEVGVFGSNTYLPNSAGELYPFSEVLYITASPNLLDVLPTFPARKPTSGRAAISNRVVFDHWRMAPGPGLEDQLRLMRACGMEDLLVILHTWMHYGYDRKQPQFTPANPERWSDEEFSSAIAACREMGYRVAVHENYNHMDWDSPYNSPTPAREFGEPNRPGDPGPAEAAKLVTADPGPDASLQPRNAWAFSRLADMRVSPGPLSRPSPPAFPISSDKMLFYSQIESHKIRDTYGTTAGYLDVTPCVQPGTSTWDIHIDLDARNRDARGFDQAYRNAARQFAHHRDIFEIATGEGGGFATYHAGYIHAVERQVGTRMQTPIMPQHELQVVRPLSLHHGMGYYSRYFGEGEERVEPDYDLYRAMEIAFGHAGFMGDDIMRGNLPGTESVREYYLMRALQEAYADAELTGIEYWDGSRWLTTVWEALGTGYDFVQARIRLRYANGLVIALNFDREKTWQFGAESEALLEDLREAGVDGDIALPTAGWAAACPERKLVALSALVDGVRRDYVVCPGYTYKHDRAARDGSAFAHPVVMRDSGLPGLSTREVPGVLACLEPEPSQLHLSLPTVPYQANLTVLNPGEGGLRTVTLDGVAPRPDCLVHIQRPVPKGEVIPELTWADAEEGTWRVSFAYNYTDPDHPEEATGLALEDAMDGPPLVVTQGAAGPGIVQASSQRNADFVEARATVRYPGQSTTGRPVTVRLSEAQFGVRGGPDNDYAEGLALVLTEEKTGKRIELPFPIPQKKETRRIGNCGSRFEFEFPARSVVTFELEAR